MKIIYLNVKNVKAIVTNVHLNLTTVYNVMELIEMNHQIVSKYYKFDYS